MPKKIFKPQKFTELIRFDWFIKYMFRDKSDFVVLEGFLSELMGEDVIILEILESEANQSHKKDKFNRVDVMVKTAKDERVIVEVQNNDEYDYLQRILYGASKAITENMKKGEIYANVKKVVSVSIVYFNVGEGFDYVYHGTTSFKGIHSNQELLLNDEQKAAFGKETPADIFPEYYLINAASFPNDKKMDGGLDEWVYFFKNGEVGDNFKAKGIVKAKEKLSVAKMNKRKKLDYDRYLKGLHSDASWNEQVRMRDEAAKKVEEKAKKLEAEAKKLDREAKRIDAEAKKLDQDAKKLDEEAKKLDQEGKKITERAAVVYEKEAAVTEKEGHLTEKEGHLSEKEGHLSEKEGHLSEKEGHLSEKEGHLSEKEKQLAVREAILDAAFEAERRRVKQEAIRKALEKGIDENTVAELNDVTVEEVRKIKGNQL